MFFNYLIASVTVFTISVVIYLKFKPSAKPVRWIMLISGAIVTILIVPLILLMAAFAWEKLIQVPAEREQYQEDYERARGVVDALFEFHSSNGYYPAELSDLVPDYLSNLPPEPYTGHPYQYQLHEDGEFSFIFRGWNGRVGFDMYCYSRNSDVRCNFAD